MSARSARVGTEPDLCQLDPTEHSIVLSAHAVERFRDRVRPALELHDAAVALERLIEHGQVCSRAPDWVARRQHQRAAFYLVVGDLVFPMDPGRRDPTSLRILTCLARGGISPAARARATRRRSRRSAGSLRPVAEAAQSKGVP